MSFDPQRYAAVAEAFTAEPIDFYIVAVIDISQSKLSQLDQWKELLDPTNAAVDRLSNRAGIVREIDVEQDSEGNGLEQTWRQQQQQPSLKWNTTYRLTLCDAKSQYSFAYEYNDTLPFLRNNLNGGINAVPVGGRLRVNKGTLIMNGVLMLNRAQCQYLGTDPGDEFSRRLQLGLAKKYVDFLTEELNTK